MVTSLLKNRSGFWWRPNDCEFQRGLDKELSAKVDASPRRFNSVIELVDGLASFDYNR